MKKILFLFAILWTVMADAQEKTVYQWPIDGAKPGEGIVSTPQSYLDDELNFSNLFVTAPEGTTVVSPVDGTITWVSTGYLTSLTYSIGSSTTSSFDQALPEWRKQMGEKLEDPKFGTGRITIRSLDGNTIHIGGLTGDQVFKTGQKITRGTPVGRVGYSYRKIKDPSIKISVDRGGKVADPMTPFGLKTTFIPPAEAKPIDSFTKEQLKEDFLIYIDALKECYPGLYDVITPEELDRYVAQTTARIDNHAGDWPYAQASDILIEVWARIHDSHISYRGPGWKATPVKFLNKQTVSVGWFNDTLLCRDASEAYQHLIGRPIKSINGISADSLKRRLIATTGSYDGKVTSYIDGMLAYGTLSLFLDRKKWTLDFNMRLEMADTGETIDVQADRPDPKSPYLFVSQEFNMANRHRKGYDLKMLNDSTAYIGLSSFSLNQVQTEDIARFIDSIAAVPYLIIDVRNNSGGSADVLSKLYTYIAGDTMTLDGYSRVNKQGGFQSFKYALNRIPEDSSFAHYSPEPGREGFYSRSEVENIIRPDSTINYKGKIYILTNENSCSAATLFPALLVRNHRGVIIGRETRTAYHYMNALKFADIRLPNTTLTITIPLVYCCFDSVVNDRAPYGRGVLPDYPVPLTIDELSGKNGDAILNHTLQLIEEGKYLSPENPFAAEEPAQISIGHKIAYVAAGVLVIAGILLIFARSKRNKIKKQKR